MKICVQYLILYFSKQDKQPGPGRKLDLKMNSDKSPVKRDKLRENEIPVKIGRQTKFISGVNNFTKCSVSPALLSSQGC